MPLDNSLGGAGAVPGSFRVIDQSPTIEVYAGNQTRDAMRITIAEQIYGVTFTITVPLLVYNAQSVQSLASEYAAAVQSIGALPEVVDMFYQEGQTAAGLSVDQLVVVVGTPDGSSTANVTIPLLTANTPAQFDKVIAGYDVLLAVSQLT